MIRERKHKIFYGPPGDTDLYWLIKVKDGPRDVLLNGTVADAMNGLPGLTVGCHLSDCGQRNGKAFSHPALLFSFTKTTCCVVSKIKNGVPVEGYMYDHPLGHLVDLNDTDKKKEYLKNTELVERQFLLRAPRRKAGSRGSQPLGRERGENTGERRSSAPKGALRRAIKAGLINAGVAKAIRRMNEKPKPSVELARRTLEKIKKA